MIFTTLSDLQEWRKGFVLYLDTITITDWSDPMAKKQENQESPKTELIIRSLGGNEALEVFNHNFEGGLGYAVIARPDTDAARKLTMGVRLRQGRGVREINNSEIAIVGVAVSSEPDTFNRLGSDEPIRITHFLLSDGSIWRSQGQSPRRLAAMLIEDFGIGPYDPPIGVRVGYRAKEDGYGEYQFEILPRE